MIRHYLLTALRNLARNKFFGLINIVGLTAGMTLFLVIQLWIGYERSFDDFHDNKDRIGQIMVNMASPGEPPTIWETMPAPVGPLMEQKIPEIESVIRTTWPTRIIIDQNGNHISQRVMYADSLFFHYFSFDIVKGNPRSVLNSRDAVVISQSLAKVLFGLGDPLNKTLHIRESIGNKDRDVMVTGVFRDVPDNSSLRFNMVIPFETYLSYTPWNTHWGNYNNRLFAVLSPHTSFAEADSKIRDFIKKNRPDNEDVYDKLFLHPLSKIHLYDDFSKGEEAGGTIFYVKLFDVISYFVLLIACINYVNLSTANASRRLKEVGLKKTIGASRFSLINQFMIESVILNILALILSGSSLYLILPGFNRLFEKHVVIPFTPGFIFLVTGMILVSVLLSGLYPSLVISKIRPQGTLGKQRSPVHRYSLRNALVVFQFILSITMIIGILVVYKQVDFIRNTNLGFNRENVLHFSIGDVSGHRDVFQQKLLSNPDIVSVCFSDQSPMDVGNSTSDPTWDNKPDNDNTYFHVIQADRDFIKTMGITLLEGENFPEKVNPSVAYYLVNQKAAEVMGMKDPVGQNLRFWDAKQGKIVGMVKDFHHQSLHGEIEPLIIFDSPEHTWNAFVRISGRDIPQTIRYIQNIYSGFDQVHPFDYKFLDADFDNMYRREILVQQLILYLTFTAVLISCLGLFGLALFTIQRRTKEIAIRKVNGARTSQLVTLVSGGFIKQVVIAFVLAGPIAWYFLNRWLENFAYKTSISWWIYAIAGFLALFIALGTVSYHAIKASLANPVNALKYE